MKKHIANIITTSRIAFSLPLLVLPLSSVWFYALYLLCGISDMIDGTVARKTKSASEFGAKLDTVSDFVFLHTVLNKAMGCLWFLLPVTISFIELTYTLPFVCAVATVAAIHEGCCVAKKKQN